MRISDWSSDVCSSDLSALRRRHSAGVGCFYRIGAAPFDPGTHREAHGTWLSQAGRRRNPSRPPRRPTRSEEHTSELQSLMRISYAVFCLKKKTQKQKKDSTTHTHKQKLIFNIHTYTTTPTNIQCNNKHKLLQT